MGGASSAASGAADLTWVVRGGPKARVFLKLSVAFLSFMESGDHSWISGISQNFSKIELQNSKEFQAIQWNSGMPRIVSIFYLLPFLS